MKRRIPVIVGILVICGSPLVQDSVIPFDAEHWNLDGAKVSEQAGR